MKEIEKMENKNNNEKKLPKKLTENKHPMIPPRSKTYFEKCPYGKEFEFFYRRFMCIL